MSINNEGEPRNQMTEKLNKIQYILDNLPRDPLTGRIIHRRLRDCLGEQRGTLKTKIDQPRI